MSIRFIGGIKELRIHLCQTNKASQGVREWIANNYVAVKKENPTFPILIRECNGIQPRVWARYEKCQEMNEDLANKSSPEVNTIIANFAKSPYKGKETSVPLTNLGSSDVTKTIKDLVK